VALISFMAYGGQHFKSFNQICDTHSIPFDTWLHLQAGLIDLFHSSTCQCRCQSVIDGAIGRFRFSPHLALVGFSESVSETDTDTGSEQTPWHLGGSKPPLPERFAALFLLAFDGFLWQHPSARFRMPYKCQHHKPIFIKFSNLFR